jgi:P-type Mg2+ transporter
VATELAVMLVSRTRRPFFHSRPSATLLGSSFVVALVAFALPYSPLASQLGYTPVPGPVLLALVTITAAYVVATELTKVVFYRSATR